MEQETREKLRDLLSKNGVKYYCVYDWDLTDEEQKKFELAGIGDEIHIETPMVPVVIDEGDGYFIGMYTDEAEIPKEFKKEKTVQLERIESFIISCKASATVLKEDVGLILNPYSLDSNVLAFSMKEVDEIYFEIKNKMEN